MYRSSDEARDVFPGVSRPDDMLDAVGEHKGEEKCLQFWSAWKFLHEPDGNPKSFKRDLKEEKEPKRHLESVPLLVKSRRQFFDCVRALNEQADGKKLLEKGHVVLVLLFCHRRI